MSVDAAEEFQESFLNWERNLQRDEWHFERFRKDILSRLDPSEAFQQIDSVVDLLIQEQDPFLCDEVGILLNDLARKSSTTQLPNNLDQRWPIVMRKITMQVAGEIAKWYRRSSE